MKIFLMLVPIIGMVLLLINVFFSGKDAYFQKTIEFECGFMGFIGFTRAPFSISFYLIGLLFLIFDLEVALLYPYVISAGYNLGYGLITVLLFLIILTVGFIYEFGVKALSLH
jgi:NADH-ubiquinone oxidoreductase chain 3